jgi:hypothetical protein
LWAGPFVAVACAALCVWFLWNSSLRELFDVAIALGVGLVVYALTRATSPG